MERSTKFIIGIGSIMLIGTGVVLWLYNKSKDKANTGGTKAKEKDTTNTNKKQSSNDDSVDTYTSAPSSSSSSDFPLKNSSQGNAFRAWVNKNYPSYAKSIQLDVTGSYNNSYIKQAWAKYGSEYQKSSSPATSNSNFTSLQKNTGIKPTSSNIIIISFNGGDNTAQFYTNNRVIIFDSNKKNIASGSYSNGGKTIKMDSGHTETSGSVYSNLDNILS